jgi:hypothetical protein
MSLPEQRGGWRWSMLTPEFIRLSLASLVRDLMSKEKAMNTKLFALASALVATAALASAATAGDGVRLNFGGPLGTFTATPSRGGGGGGGNAGAYSKPPAYQAARKPDKPAPRVAKGDTEKSGASETTDTASQETESPRLTGTSALIQQSTPVETHEGDAAAADASATPATEVKAEAPAPAAEPSKVTTAATDKAPAETDPAPAATDQAAASTDQAPASTDESGNCKKFIPAIGMTVSVGCGQ